MSHQLLAFKTNCVRTHAKHRGVFAVKGTLFSSAQHEGPSVAYRLRRFTNPRP